MEKANLLKTVTVTVVVCDRCRYGGRLVSQFGLSLLADCSWEDGRGRRILFDTGSDGQVLLRNLDELGVPVDSIDLVVLSHAHYDHTGGLEGLVRAEGARFQLVAHSEITRRVFSQSFGLRFIGVDVQILSEIPPHRLLLIEEAARIFPDVWTTGTIPRWCEFEQPGEDVHVLTDEGALIPDREMDDMALLFRVGGDRLVILTGCSHAGIINTVERAVEVGGCDRID
ncbi:MAG: MBL fold metallo-hydrolase, partial [Bacillota bacterium]